MALQIVLLDEIVEVESRDAHTILTMLKHLAAQNVEIMATLKEIQDSLTTLETTVAAESQAITDLASRAGQPPAATAADLSALKARIDVLNSTGISDTAKIAAIDQPPVVTPPPPAA